MAFLSKGCSRIDYSSSATEANFAYISQQSVNPSVYTKVSCYLPWIAEQYDMDYEQTNSVDPDCLNGNGNIDDVTAKVCRTTPTRSRAFPSYIIVNDRAEAQCIFPFSFDGEKNMGCLVSGIEGFTLPVFRCPIRTIKYRGTNYLREALQTKQKNYRVD